MYMESLKISIKYNISSLQITEPNITTYRNIICILVYVESSSVCFESITIKGRWGEGREELHPPPFHKAEKAQKSQGQKGLNFMYIAAF